MNAVADIIAGLGAESWRTRKECAAAAARWPRPGEVIPELVVLLSVDAGVSARSAAVEALAAIGAAAVPALVAVVESGGDARKFAIDALSAMAPPAARTAAPALRACLADDEGDENVRAAAAEALGGLGLRPGPETDACEAALRRQLRHGELLTRLCAVEALVSLDARLPLAEVVPLLDTPLLRPAALELCGRSGELDALPYLLHALAEPSAARVVRAAAMRALVALHGRQEAGSTDRGRVESSTRASAPSAVAAIVASLEEGPLAVRRAAATLCGWGRFGEALPALATGLCDDEVHHVAAAAIAAYGPFAVAPLLDLGRAAAPSLRREIIAVFPRLGAAAGDARVAELCVRALGDEEGPTAAAAARTLGEVGGKDALGPLVHALERGGEVGQAAGAALARLAVRWPDEVRLLAGARPIDGPAGAGLCRVLAALGHPDDGGRLLAALRAGEPALRRAAASSLASFPAGADVIQALTYALADDDPATRAAAAASLGALGARDAVKALAGACRDPDPATAVAATRALGQLADPATAPIVRALVAAGGAVAFAAVEALGRLGDPADDDLLAQTLARPDPETVKAAARALADRPRPAPRAALAALLDHPRWDVRRAAAQALACHPPSPERAAALRARAAVEEDGLVGEALVSALGETGT